MSIWKRESSLETLAAECRRTLVEHIGIEFTELGEESLRGRMPVDARTHQPYGLLHGGASVVLAETLGSIAANLCLADESKMAVGLEINANHVRAVRQGWVEGCARPLHIGGTTQLWEIRIEDERGRLVCMSRLTMAVVNRG
ncbi:MAG: esterase [Salinicola sp.]|uniref:hotdog fold thioesterase n=1 Tax=uncultured Salinicola sp. TaxID=1193542 RepID=UPI000C8C2C14|nr:hotdog fold thioesterase [uncultured Salinicola sp.]MAM59839.1 esterase [Salinicola sp.]|tara:strand:- start:145 stop:570 length:426 start_codon:yes stop_codon:yes gene_type:complete